MGDTEISLASPYNDWSNPNNRIYLVLGERGEEKEEEIVVEKEELREDEAKKFSKFFNYKIYWRDVIPTLGEEPKDLHQTKELWYDKVPSEFAAKKTYEYLINLKSSSKELDGSKFSKWVKSLPDVVDGKKIKQTDIDLIFAKSKPASERKLSLANFLQNAICKVAELRYPWLESTGEGLESPCAREFMKKQVFMWKECADLVWMEARRLAIVQEAKMALAARRIQCEWRMHVEYANFWKIKGAVEKLRVQFFIRCIVRFRFLRQIAELREQERKRKEAIREKRKAKRDAMLYREARSINGTLNVVTVYKHSRRDIYLVTYNPVSQEVFSFVMARSELRSLLEAAHNTGTLSENEMFIKPNMRLLCDQLMYRRRAHGSVIVLSAKGGGERGNLVCRRGKYICGSYCVAQVYQYFKNYIFKVYDIETSEIFRTELTDKQLNRWFGRKECDAVPTLLRPENRNALITWFLDRIFMCRGCNLLSHQHRHKNGHDVLMLEFEKEDIRKEGMALRIQNMWRAKRARDMF